MHTKHCSKTLFTDTGVLGRGIWGVRGCLNTPLWNFFFCKRGPKRGSLHWKWTFNTPIGYFRSPCSLLIIPFSLLCTMILWYHAVIWFVRYSSVRLWVHTLWHKIRFRNAPGPSFNSHMTLTMFLSLFKQRIRSSSKIYKGRQQWLHAGTWYLEINKLGILFPLISYKLASLLESSNPWGFTSPNLEPV